MPWTGNPSRVSHAVGYRQDDPAVIEKQLQVMKSAGIEGVIAWWQGPTHAFTNDAFTKMFYACLKAGMLFLPALDGWIAKDQPNPTQAVISALTSLTFKGMAPLFAEKWVLEFDLASIGVNLALVQAAIPGTTLLSKHTGYSWPETTNTMQTLLADNANPQMRVPCVFSRFNDGGYPLPNGVSDPAHFNGQRDWNASVWNSPKEYADPKLRKPTRIIEEQGGKTYEDSLSAVPAAARYMGLVTWNDYDEGTEHEPECNRANDEKENHA